MLLQQAGLNDAEPQKKEIRDNCVQTAKFIETLLADGQAGGEFRPSLNPKKMGFVILGALPGIEHQAAVNPVLDFAGLLAELRAALLEGPLVDH